MKPERLEEIRRALAMRPAYPLGKQEVVELAEELLVEVDRLGRLAEERVQRIERLEAHECQCTECQP